MISFSDFYYSLSQGSSSRSKFGVRKQFHLTKISYEVLTELKMINFQ